MNTKKIIVLSGLMVLFLSLSSFKSVSDLKENINKIEAQEGFVVYAAYSGKTDSGYNFVATNRNGEKQTITFQKVNDDVLVAFNLNSEAFIGKSFKITFSKESTFTEGAVDTNTITKLEKLSVG